MGKTSFVNHLMVNLMENSGWRFLVYSAENLPYATFLSRLQSLYLGKPFFAGPSQKLSKEELNHGLQFFHEHLRLVDASKNITLDGILDEAESLMRHWPFQGIVIDPWNELLQDRIDHKTETELIGEQLTRFRRFCRTRNLHSWIVAHPTKMQRNQDTGEYAIPTAYDIAGSAHWRNKADFVLAVHRDMTDSNAHTKVLIQKVRFSEHGQLGCVELRFNKMTGQYADLQPLSLVNT